MILYGLKNCDTTRKARRWLTERDCSYEFVDVRDDGVDESTVRTWLAAVGWETLVNRRGTTWRQLNEAQRSDVDEAKALALIMQYPALIKRPVFQTGGDLLVGFDAEAYAATLA